MQGAAECRAEVRTVVTEQPRENCSLEPRRTCRLVSRLVPRLQEVQQCQQVPSQVCNTARQNPHRITRPIFKKWCFVPE